VKNAKKEKLERVTLYLPPSDIRGLTDVEKTTRVNTSEYMRLLVDAFLRYYQESDRKISLPIVIVSQQEYDKLKERS
jgi:hypothetical protein